MLADPQRRHLSEEDLDLQSLSGADFDTLSAAALRAAQATNDQDAHIYRHGCIAVEPGFEHLLGHVCSGAL